MTLARELRAPSGLGFALVYAAYVHQMRREPALVLGRTDEALALATEHGLADVMGWSAIWRGWALAVGTGGGAGTDAIGRGLAAQRAFGSEIVRPHALALLAEACRLAGRPDDARAALDEAAAQAARTGDRYYEPEVHRLRGELLGDAAEAEACFRTAIDRARAMGARSLALRATVSLARLLVGRGARGDRPGLQGVRRGIRDARPSRCRGAAARVTAHRTADVTGTRDRSRAARPPAQPSRDS